MEAPFFPVSCEKGQSTQLICNQQVGGSSPSTSSKPKTPICRGISR
nr:MAG TPA: hypothetical protein [Caudoviricetes sp.]